MNDPPVAATISGLLANLKSASLLAIGVLVGRLASHAITQVPKVADAVIVLPEPLVFEQLFTFRGLVKSGATSISVHFPAVIRLLKKHVESPPEALQLVALKLMKTFFKRDQQLLGTALECVDVCLLRQQVPFVRYEASKLAAFAAVSQPNLDFLRKYSGALGYVLRHYLELKPAPTIIGNFQTIYRLVRECAPNDFGALVPFLTSAARDDIFRRLLSERTPSVDQVAILLSLSTRDEAFYSAAGADLQLAKSEKQRDRDYASFFFTGLAGHRPAVASMFLKAAVSSVDKSERFAVANATAAAALLQGNPGLAAHLEFRELVDACLKFEMTSIRFSVIWNILAVMPAELFRKERIVAALRPVRDAIVNNPSDKPDERYLFLLEGLMQFYGGHPDYPYTVEICEYADQLFDMTTERTLSGYVDLAIASRRQCDLLLPRFIERASIIYPGRPFLCSQIGRVLVRGDDLIGVRGNVNETFLTARQEFCQKVIVRFPDLLRLCGDDARESIVNDILTKTEANELLVLHSMLLSAVRAKVGMPRSFTGNLLKTLKGGDYLRIQISCEIVSVSLEHDMSLADPLFRFVEMNKRAVSCLLLSSIFCRVHLPSTYLTNALLFLSEQLFSHYSAPFALHAIETALNTHPEDIRDLGIGGQHLSLMLNQLNSPTSLHPMVAHLHAAVFTKLLPITASHPIFESTIVAILNTLKSTPCSLVKGIIFNTVAILSSISLSLANAVTIEFPQKSVPMPLVVAAADAFASIGRPAGDAQTMLLAVQRASDGRAIRALGEALVRLPIGEFVRVLISVFVRDKLGEHLPLAPCYQVKLTLLTALRQSILKVTGDAAPQVAVALCIAAASGYQDLQAIAFESLQVLIDQFKLDFLSQQFEQLVEIALTLDLSTTGGFLAKCMKAGTMEKCIQPLLNVRQLTPEYFAVTAKVIEMNSEKVEEVRGFLPILMSPLKLMVEKVLKNQSTG
jgi:hypothetical protein